MIFDLIAGLEQPAAAPSSLSIVGSSKAAAATSVNVPAVSGLAVGDILLAFMSVRTASINVTFTGPAGWTAILQNSATGSNPTVFAKVAEAADIGSSFAFSANNGASMGAIVVAIRGANASVAAIGLSAIFSASGTQTSPYDCPSNSVVASADSNIVLRFYSCNSALTMSLPTDTTLVNSFLSSGSTFSQVVSETVGAGTAPSKISTFSAASVSAPGGLSVAIPSL